MLLPFYGRTRPVYEITGEADDNGFLLNCNRAGSFVWTFEICARESEKTEFPKKDVAKAFGWIFTGLLIVGFLGFSVARPSIIPTTPTILIAFSVVFWAVVSFCLSTLAIAFLMLNRPTKEWHACEHKLAYLLNTDIPITLDNLRTAPKTSLRCSAAVVLCLIQVLCLSFACFLALAFKGSLVFHIFAWATFVCSISTLAFGTSGEIYSFSPCKSERSASFCLLLLLALPAILGFILPLAGERIFTLKEPPEEKLQQTVEEWHRFQMTHNFS